MSGGRDTTVYIGLGGNLGDRAGTLRSAVAMIDDLDAAAVRAVSDCIETAPVGGPPGQPPFLNAVAKITTSLEPEALMASLHDIERALGRDRGAEERFGPRTCDLDILLFGDRRVDTPALTIPHPRMRERGFVLRPLAAIAPGAVDPVTGRTAADLLAALNEREPGDGC